jgi:hypothetical protein
MYKLTTFISKKQAEEYHEPSDKMSRVIISLTTPSEANNTRSYSGYCKPAKLHEDTWKDILRLEFHDKDPETIRPGEKSGYKLFNDEHAIKILKFLKLHQDDTTDAIVHCEAGISRSAAVSKFISIVYSLPFPESYSIYNKHIFSTLMKVYNISLYGDGPIAFEDLPRRTE